MVNHYIATVTQSDLNGGLGDRGATVWEKVFDALERGKIGSAVKKAPIILLATIMFSGGVQASAILADYSWNFSLTSGSDTLGLDDASGVLSMTFDTTQTYLTRFGEPSIDALTHALSISGAFVGSSNGSHSEADGMAIYPTWPHGIFWDGGAAGGHQARFDIGALALTMTSGLIEGTAAGATATPGDFVDISHFGTTPNISSPATFNSTDGSKYTFINLTANVRNAQVPEPGTLALLLFGLAGTGYAARKQKRRRGR